MVTQTPEQTAAVQSKPGHTDLVGFEPISQSRRSLIGCRLGNHVCHLTDELLLYLVVIVGWEWIRETESVPTSLKLALAWVSGI